MRHSSWRTTKSYRFNGQRVALRKNGVLRYLHGDQLDSTVLTTNSRGATTGNEGDYAYGRQHIGHELGTENRFTAPGWPPKRNRVPTGHGLQSFNAQG